MDPSKKTGYPHDMLLDYGVEFVDINKYDGILRSDNYMNVALYKDIYNTRVTTRTSLGVSGIEPPVQEEAQWKNYQQQKSKASTGLKTASMILNGLYYKYSSIRSDALSTNKICYRTDKKFSILARENLNYEN